ncbi:MAG: hypothetical protein Q7S40_28390 [Opitutaceae bacterium]|nr:hypothetical protein [Opitutaceae bacterium]
MTDAKNLNELSTVLVDRCVESYLSSHDFNGLNLSSLAPNLPTDPTETKQWLGTLIERDLIALRLENAGNPFIRHFPDPEKAVQLEELAESNLSLVVVYPTSAVLAKRVDFSHYAGQPFALRLALGEAQLDYHSFDLSVLEFYRNDPRFRYRVDDVFGAIWMQDEHAEQPGTAEADNTYLQSFGFSYDDDMNRSVLVFNRYLSDLTPEHQSIWEAKRLKQKGRMHPDYYRSSIRGMFADHVPVLKALTMEMHHINRMSELMGRCPLFRKDFNDDEIKPRGFTLLIRPTAKEFYDFVLLLDQMLSDNITKEFFENDVPLTEEIPRGEGRFEIRQRGTLALLEEWVRTRFVPVDPKPIDNAFAALRKVRKLRQKPAHAPVDGQFDQQFFKDQRALIIEAYGAMRTLRLIFKNHPACVNYSVEAFLDETRIRTY